MYSTTLDSGCSTVAVKKEPPAYGGSFYPYRWGSQGDFYLYIGDRPGTRTRNLLIKSQLLCQLS